MHVIVTGGAGFIGSNVAASFLRDGHHVTVFDNMHRHGSERNLAWLHSLPQAAGLRFVEGDVRQVELVRSVIGARDVHLVFHFAAQTAVTTSLVDPRTDLDINVIGTHNVLEAVRQSGAVVPPMLFFTSTNKVYGALSHRKSDETATRFVFADAELATNGIDELEPLDFHSPYGCSKGAADQYVRDYSRIYGLRTVVFRMSCIYGPRQFGNEDQGWVAHFMMAVAGDRPLSIYGNGKQVRDLLFIDDLVDAFRLAALHIESTAGHVYNMGGGPTNTVSIWTELRPRLEQLAGRQLHVRMHDWRPGDQPVYVSDTRRAQRDFGWQPRIGVDEGLRRLWQWAQAVEGAAAVRDGITHAPKSPRKIGLGLSRPGIALANPSA
ncbi:MAG TPA: GDP-mannose 4,6-dehydratase [Chloroflexota bacterium]|nr:GDP-mannose 4,6-dehydratase [Chloroflexota bacterium]